jgi:phenylpropionate dioxygenase-like ring-hydroxylating dioxygenase large terminal subunit
MLRNHWYPILEAASLGAGRGKKSIAIKRFGIEFVLWRDTAGEAQLLPATCPHRGASMAGGRVVDGDLVCPWHGFRFSGTGHCTLIPCEGPDARIPKALGMPIHPIREEHDLIWMWWGDEQASYPEIPFYHDIEANDGFTEASYILPYHYSRMIESNLDLHHTPFVHGNVIPVGTRMLDFEASVDGDRITSRGTLVKEKSAARGEKKGTTLRADLILPNLGLVALTPNLHLLVCATPVDEDHSWMWFRYRQTYTRSATLGKILTWIAVHSELRVVQKQDWRIFASMTPGTIDDFPYAFVHSDKAIALYRNLRSQRLKSDPRVETEATFRAHSDSQRSAAAN